MKAITDTGLRGYMKWLIQDQPNLARVVVPQIAARYPQAFSDHDQSTVMGILHGMGDASGDDTSVIDSLTGSAFPSVDQILNTSTPGKALSLSQTSSLAATANMGSVDPSVTAGIGNIINSTMQALGLSSNTAASYGSLTNSQLLQAQNGYAPLSATSASTGIGALVGKITGSLGGTTGVLLIGAVLLGAGLLLSSSSGGTSRAKR